MGEGARSVGERRRYLAAVALAVLSVGGLAAYVLASTWWAGSSVSPEARVRPPPGPDSVERLEADPGAVESVAGASVPEGDYRAFCDRLSRDIGLGDDDVTVAELIGLLDRLDFPGLIDAAPEAVRPSIETVRDGRDALVAQLVEAGSTGELDASQVDPDLLDAVGVLSQVGLQECAGG